MCVCVFLLFSASADLFIMCQVPAPSLVVKRGQIVANCPDCQLSAAVGLFIHTENSISHSTYFCLSHLHVKTDNYPLE